MNLSYVQAGSGRDLLMLHDFAGMGGAEALTEPFSVDDYADWTERAMGELGVREPLVIAHSFGGRVAIKLLARGRIPCAVLVGCAGIVRHGVRYKLRVGAYRLAKKLSPRRAEKFGSADYRGLSPVMRESFKKIVNEDLRKDARSIGRPVLFVCGDRDRETPIKNVRLLHEAVKGSRLVVLHGAGHFAYLDDPLGFRLAAEDFFHDHD